ncbi:bacterial proteasome activator family protein [Luteimicrobium sp. NPDC057192]|uniref:bacterial proteasome activator family protein n=1 Tax=Luteimicrobium sp. NPDC057192 TaxID=3346042 RepID=UPI0036445261
MPDDAQQQVPPPPDDAEQDTDQERDDEDQAEREARRAAEEAVREAAAAQQASQLILPPGVTVSGEDAGEEGERASIEEPAKVMRIGTMIKRLLDEVRESPLDEAARARLASIHERSLHELEDGLSPDLIDELHRITLPFTDDQTPSDAELRIAQAQLVGWLEGLFHGIQTALVAQQLAAQQQLTQMRRTLPPGLFGPSGPGQPGQVPGAPGGSQGDDQRPTPGQYL